MPSGGTDFAVFFNEDKGVNNAQGFVYVASDGQVIDDLMADDAVFIDEKRGAHGDSVIIQNAVIVRYLFCDVGNQRKFYVSDAANVRRHLFPGQM